MQVSTVFAALAGAERVCKVMDTEPENMNSVLGIEEEIIGDVVLKNVNFGYVHDVPVLKNISLFN